MNSEAMKARVERAMERYERKQTKLKRRNAWSKVNRNGVRIPLNELRRTTAMREAGTILYNLGCIANDNRG